MQRNTIPQILSNLQCRKIPRGIRIKLENHFLPTGNKMFLKIKFSELLSRKSHSAKNGGFSSQNYFFSSRHQVRVPVDEMKLSERTHRAEKSSFPQSLRKLISYIRIIKNYNAITLKTRETYFFYRKPQKTKNYFQFFTSLCHIVPKKPKAITDARGTLCFCWKSRKGV